MSEQRPVDIAIVTVKHEEYEAMHTRLRNTLDEPGTVDAPNLFGWETGWIDREDGRGAYRVVLSVVGRPTAVQASQAITATVQRWRPRYVVFVGIAGGFPREQCALGDVVVSSVICAYEYGKLEQEYQVRPRTYNADVALLSSATSFVARHREWASAIEGGPAKALLGPVASGDKIIDDPTNEFFAAVERIYPGLQAVEMEGAGAALAIDLLQSSGMRVGFIMVRGISDMPKASSSGSQKDERDRNLHRACASAAQFTTQWIARSWPVMPTEPSAVAPPLRPAVDDARFDLFLAHASGDATTARHLYHLLRPDVEVFLDEVSLMPGDRWDREIPAAQRASRATVVLVSPRCDAAWYLGAEVVTGIAMHRAAPAEHRLIPVILEPTVAIPYGLEMVQAIRADGPSGLAGVATSLRNVVAQLRGLPPPPAAPPPAPMAGGGGVPGRPGPCDARALHDRLVRIPDPLFERVVFLSELDRSLISPTNASLAVRVLDVAQMALIDVALCHRLGALLDQHAPWTRVPIA